ncbi:DMT family transporter [Novosphingobium sp. 1949]|uniref:DMT family transporter n=1 Tax=Novosphingobium organovorum TaxID=2930092 RepID=A0ABT0BGZ9_9SPHN|nr:DMT family transporter [Novosphingobium organovorum]MCJ2184331.1 DMT family transporter [Novosphingobium organovorum]
MTRASLGFSPANPAVQGIACGMGAGALWGLVFLAPQLLGDFAPIQIAIGRYLAYGVIAFVLFAPRRAAVLAAIGRREWCALAALAFTGNTLYYILLSSAVQQGGIAMTSLVIGFLPVVVTIVGSRDKGAVPLVRLAPALLLCALGAVCIGWQALSAPVPGGLARQLIGLGCALGALVSWSAFAVGNARCLARLEHVGVHDWNLLTGIVTGLQALALVPFALVLAPGHHAAGAWLHFLGVSVGIALAASIVGNALWNRMSRLLPLTLVGQMILFETLFALLYGFVWEQRLPTLLELAAFGLVVASVLTCVAAHQRPRPLPGALVLTGEGRD